MKNKTTHKAKYYNILGGILIIDILLFVIFNIVINLFDPSISDSGALILMWTGISLHTVALILLISGSICLLHFRKNYPALYHSKPINKKKEWMLGITFWPLGGLLAMDTVGLTVGLPFMLFREAMIAICVISLVFFIVLLAKVTNASNKQIAKLPPY